MTMCNVSLRSLLFATTCLMVLFYAILVNRLLASYAVTV